MFLRLVDGDGPITGKGKARRRSSGVRRCSIGTKYAQVLGLARRAKRIQTVTDFIKRG